MNVRNRHAPYSLALLMLAFVPLGAAQAQQVKVTAADPASTTQGTVSLDVTVSGSGFDSTASPTFFVSGTTDTGGITVRKTLVKGSKQLIATIDVADTAAVAKFDIEVTLDGGRKGKGTTLFSVNRKVAATDPCQGETAAFAFWKRATNMTPVRDLYLSNPTATCQRYLLSLSAGNFHRYSSFRVVVTDGRQEGRLVTTDGASDLLLIRFPIGVDMGIDPATVTVQRIFDPAQDGTIDVTDFELAADGHRLAYVTSNEDGGTTWLSRLRFIDDVDACVPSTPGALACRYDVGLQLAEHVGLSYVLSSPRWGTDGSWIYFEDRRGDFYRPYISRVSPQAPLPVGAEAEIVHSGNDLRLFELRSHDGDEVMAYGEKFGSGCHDVRVVRTASCTNGSCTDRVNSTSPRVMAVRFATLQSIDNASMTILADGAQESRKGSCSGTDQITRAVDSTTNGVEITSLTPGAGPASR
jgi:hypothetical protein